MQSTLKEANPELDTFTKQLEFLQEYDPNQAELFARMAVDLGEANDEANALSLEMSELTEEAEAAAEAFSTIGGQIGQLNNAYSGIKNLSTVAADLQDGKLAWENIAQLYSDFGELEDFDTYIDVLLGGGETAASYADQMEVLTEMTRQKIVAAAGGWESLAGVDERVLTAMLESAGVENATAVATDMLTEANEKLTQVIE